MLVALFALAACAPPYVWGSDEEVRANLLEIVPVGSSVATLAREGLRRDWRINPQRIRYLEGGEASYFDDCFGRGGAAIDIVIAEYATPFTTVVESIWLFDRQKRLQDVCVRKTIDAM